jgi:hypothetical protein
MKGGAVKPRINKTVEREKLIAELKVDGRDPISFFASTLRNENAPLDLRFAAAKELAPYAHPKLASIEARTGGKSHEDRLAELQDMLADEGGRGETEDQGQGGWVPGRLFRRSRMSI